MSAGTSRYTVLLVAEMSLELDGIMILLQSLPDVHLLSTNSTNTAVNANTNIFLFLIDMVASFNVLLILKRNTQATSLIFRSPLKTINRIRFLTRAKNHLLSSLLKLKRQLVFESKNIFRAALDLLILKATNAPKR